MCLCVAEGFLILYKPTHNTLCYIHLFVEFIFPKINEKWKQILVECVAVRCFRSWNFSLLCKPTYNADILLSSFSISAGSAFAMLVKCVPVVCWRSWKVSLLCKSIHDTYIVITSQILWTHTKLDKWNIFKTHMHALYLNIFGNITGLHFIHPFIIHQKRWNHNKVEFVRVRCWWCFNPL